MNEPDHSAPLITTRCVNLLHVTAEFRDVWLARTRPDTLLADVDRAVVEMVRRGLDPARPTFVKFNGNFNLPYPGSNTSSWFLDALFAALRAHGVRELFAIEGDLPEFRAIDMIRSTRLTDALDRHAVPFVPLESLPRAADGLPARLRTAQLINAPVPHTHAQAVISCAVKNLFGVLPVDRRKYHGVLEDKLLELRTSLPCFTIVDATVGLEGESTRRGNPVRCDLIVCGTDTLAVDQVVARIMGFAPDEIPVLRLAMARGLLLEPVIGGDFASEPLPEYPFQLGLSPVRRLTNLLNRTPLVAFEPLWRVADVLRTRLHRWNRRIKQHHLESGPWMEYEQTYRRRIEKVNRIE